MDIEELYKVYLENPVICTDTRNIEPNSIFFALKGENFNGNKFAQDAINDGCSFAVIDEKEYAVREDCILVDNVLETLQQLAKHHREKLTIPIIGITGSNGKTTTKELMHAVLLEKYNAFATRGNLNNHIGVPLSLLSVKPEHDIAIIEMGANHVGEIEFLCGLSQPDYGIITNIGKAHLEGFGSYENVIVAKTELYHSIRSKEQGRLFVNSDNDLLMAHSVGLNCIYYGTDKDAYVSASLIEGKDKLTFLYEGRKVVSNLVGEYNFENALAAIAVGKYFDVPTDKIIKAINEYEPTNNRSQLVKTKSNSVIMDAYNANPVSMKAAILNLSSQVGSKLAILGDMRELGEYSEKEHSDILELISNAGIDNAILVGKEFFNISDKRYPTFKTTEEAKEYLQANKVTGSTILVKGSRGIKLEILLEEL